ncbi:MAG TPA: MoxR family ATPase [Chitinophagales bacterium]|nr:MoxR family ATPase [Chitinophagales bacterium]
MLQPTGSEALLIALQTPAPKGYTGIPVLVWGPPGVGKSSFLEALAAPNFPVLTLIASIHDPTDFSGLPVFHNGAVHYAVPEWVKQFETSGEGILFLDELTTAPPAVQAALLRVVLERKVGFHQLPPRVRIVAAANPPDLMTGGWDLSPPLRNRFVHLYWDLPVQAFLHALENGYHSAQMPHIDAQQHANLLPYWKLRTLAFLKTAPNLLRTNPEADQHAFASPRTWDFATALMASCDVLGKAPKAGNKGDTVFYELLGGCLGNSVALPFIEFITKLRLPDPDTVLNGSIAVKVKDLNDSELFVLFGSLNAAIERRYNQPNQLLPAAQYYLQLTQSVFDNNRRDVIYVSLKKALKNGLLLKIMESARKSGTHTHQNLLQTIQTIFTDEGIKEFVDIFEKK